MQRTILADKNLELGKEAVVEHIQRVMRAGAFRPAEFGFQWCDNAEDYRLKLRIRWGDQTLELWYHKEDVKSWTSDDEVRRRYHAEARDLFDWLMHGDLR